MQAHRIARAMPRNTPQMKPRKMRSAGEPSVVMAEMEALLLGSGGCIIVPDPFFGGVIALWIGEACGTRLAGGIRWLVRPRGGASFLELPGFFAVCSRSYRER